MTVGMAGAATVDSMAGRKMPSMTPASTTLRWRGSTLICSPRTAGPQPRDVLRLAIPRSCASSGLGPGTPEPRQEVVDGQILVRAPRRGPPADRPLRGLAAPRVEVGEALPHGEVAGGAHVAAPESPRQEPLGGPATEAADPGQLGDHLLVGTGRQPAEVELAPRHQAGQPDDVLGLPRRELHPAQVADLRLRQRLGSGERVEALAFHLDRAPEAAHEAAP